MFKGKGQFVSGLLVGAVLFGSTAAFAASSTKIDVYFQPLKYYFDKVEKKAPSNQQGFIYKGTTYVPLRFMSEALGKEVSYEGKTYSIYVGEQPSGKMTYMEEMKTFTSDTMSIKPLSSFVTNTGEEFSHGYIGTSSWVSGYLKNTLKNEYTTNGTYTKFEAYLAPSEAYNARPVDTNVGELKIYGDDELIYSSGAIRSDITAPVKVDVDLKGVLKVRVEFKCSSRDFGLLDAKFIR